MLQEEEGGSIRHLQERWAEEVLRWLLNRLGIRLEWLAFCPRLQILTCGYQGQKALIRELGSYRWSLLLKQELMENVLEDWRIHVKQYSATCCFRPSSRMVQSTL